MTTERPDNLDISTLEAFLESRVGKIFMGRVLGESERHVRTCQDASKSMEEIRVSQGALKAIYAVLDLPAALRKEVLRGA